MDDVLARMLEIERQAADVTAQADTQAELIREQGRQQTQAEQEHLRRTLDDLAKERIATKVAEAEEQRRESLLHGEQRMQRQAGELRQKVARQVEQLSRFLAFPMESPTPTV